MRLVQIQALTPARCTPGSPSGRGQCFRANSQVRQQVHLARHGEALREVRPNIWVRIGGDGLIFAVHFFRQKTCMTIQFCTGDLPERSTDHLGRNRVTLVRQSL